MKTTRAWILGLSMLAVATLGAAPPAGKLNIGWAAADITPDRPVALAGQMHTRVSKYVKDRIGATALALETTGAAAGQAILVSLDLVLVESALENAVRQRVRERLRSFDAARLLLMATHTHTAPETRDGRYEIPPGVMTAAEYRAFAVERIVEAVVKAWDGRKPGGVSWGLGQAVIGHNRRAVYADGTARMYGKTDRADFRNLEGYEDHGLELLFLWDSAGTLTGVAINVSCPSQVVEGQSYVSADLWSDVRKLMKERRPENPYVLPMTGASGDQSPHLLFRRKAEERLRERLGLSETEELALRIVNAVDYVLPAVKKDIRQSVPFLHKVEQLRLPVRKITAADAEAARQEFERLSKLPAADRSRYVLLRRAQDVMERYKLQFTEPYYAMTLHALRLGDIAIATNPFELYLDFGVQMKARSRAEQTFVVQLSGSGTYVPTAKAVAGGHYGAEPASNLVGPEGGQLMTDRTVEVINSMWPDN